MKKMKHDLKPNQISVFYSYAEIEDGFDVSMFHTYYYSTITTDINQNCKHNAVRVTIKNGLL